LSDITLKNVNVTELWFLKEHLSNNNFDMESIGFEARTPKFGYSECHVDIEDTRYLVKHKSYAGMTAGQVASRVHRQNEIFYVQKYNKPIK
jgi:hypothetical protein